ncbi:hypothetical protein GC167_08690 [bacterium]|nr:hypothetical protein [bacterium]
MEGINRIDSFEHPGVRRTVYVLIGLYIAVQTAVFARGEWWAPVLPFALLSVALALFSLDKLLGLLVFVTPFSVTLEEFDLGVAISLPSEPLMVGVLVLFVLKLLVDGRFDPAFVKHPLSLVVAAQLVWMFFTAMTSELPWVSFKYLLSRLWFVVSLYYVMSTLFRTQKGILRFFWLYLIPLAGVVVYTLIVHSESGFSKESSVNAMYPLVKEHTSYGAILGLFLPASFFLAFRFRMGLDLKTAAIAIFLLLMAGLVFSYTRAAWVGIVAALGAGLSMHFRMNRAWFWRLAALFLGLVFLNRATLFDRLERNDQDSSDDIGEHVESISNISTDASNLERINRWNSALRMFEDRPLTGFGPGTYQFVYAPYQNPREKTIISTNNGDVGNAHSEYLGALSEQGLPGFLLVVLLVYLSFKTGIRVYYRTRSQQTRFFAMMAVLGLITYWVHGFLNNFLDMDKTSMGVWGLTALIVRLDLGRKGEELPDDRPNQALIPSDDRI